MSLIHEAPFVCSCYVDSLLCVREATFICAFGLLRRWGPFEVTLVPHLSLLAIKRESVSDGKQEIFFMVLILEKSSCKTLHNSSFIRFSGDPAWICWSTCIMHQTGDMHTHIRETPGIMCLLTFIIQLYIITLYNLIHKHSTISSMNTNT